MHNQTKQAYYQQKALAIFRKRVQALSQSAHKMVDLPNQLGHLFTGMEVCPRNDEFLHLCWDLFNILRDIPIRYGLGDKWAELALTLLECTPPDKLDILSLLYWLRAKVAYEQARVESAKAWGNIAVNYAHLAKNLCLITDTAQTYAAILVRYTSIPEHAITVIHQAQDAIHQLGMTPTYRLDFALADALRHMGKIRQARRLLENVATHRTNDNLSLHERGVIQHNLGLIRWADGAYQQAEQNFLMAITIFDDELQELNSACKIYADFGGCLWSWGKLSESEVAYHKALKLAQRLDDYQHQMKLYGNLGLVYLSQGAFKQAEWYIKEHITRAYMLDNDAEGNRGWGNLAQLALYQFGNPHESLQYLNQKTYEPQHPNEEYGNDLIVRCLCHFMLGEHDVAKVCLDRVWDICDIGEHSLLPILAHRIAAELYPDKAGDYLELALLWAERHDRRLDMAGCLLKLGKLCDNEAGRHAYYADAKRLLTEMNGLGWLTLGDAPLLPLML
jgi:tetratricopeptide (TPR) repeat protein